MYDTLSEGNVNHNTVFAKNLVLTNLVGFLADCFLHNNI